MARSKSSSSRLRYLHPAYYLKRPKRLLLVFIAVVLLTVAVWDRISLVSEHEAENVIMQLRKIFPSDGLLPIFINPQTGSSSYSTTITFGAMGDSFYEYLLKVWIQGNRTEAVKHYREMWETSMEGLVSLVRKTSPSSFSYLCEKNGESFSDKMDELACFVPGMLALGVSGYGQEKANKILSLAKEVNTGAKDNKMQSFFLAETLKYLYLLFSPPSLISFDEWVFNTEAHPLRIVHRSDGELKQTSIYKPFGRKHGKYDHH